MIRKSGNGGGVIRDEFGAENLRKWVCAAEVGGGGVIQRNIKSWYMLRIRASSAMNQLPRG